MTTCTAYPAPSRAVAATRHRHRYCPDLPPQAPVQALTDARARNPPRPVRRGPSDPSPGPGPPPRSDATAPVCRHASPRLRQGKSVGHARSCGCLPEEPAHGLTSRGGPLAWERLSPAGDRRPRDERGGEATNGTALGATVSKVWAHRLSTPTPITVTFNTAYGAARAGPTRPA